MVVARFFPQPQPLAAVLAGLLAVKNHTAETRAVQGFIDKLSKRVINLQSLPLALLRSLQSLDSAAVAAAGVSELS